MRDHRFLVIPDLHAPFHCTHGLAEIIKFSKHHKPTHIIQIGDALDIYAFSRFSKSLNISDMTAKQELQSGRRVLENMWKKLQSNSPRAKCYQLVGNHEHRVEKRIMETLPELVDIYDPSELWKFDNVISITDPRKELIIDNIMFIHGYKSRLGDHVRFNHMSVVHGHCHRPGISFIPIKGRSLYEMDCGHCLDVQSIAAGYTSQRITGWTKSFGWIDKYGPRVICLG